MSESKEHFYRDFSKFDKMSTEELNEILRQDSQLPDGEDSDTDAILYIMGVIAKRNQELPSSDFGDVNHAWSSFNKNYRFASSEGCSLFDFDDEPQLNGTSDKTQILRPAPRSNTRPRKWVLRTARILAAVIAVLLATSLTAYAFGFDLWGAIASWTKETFGFRSAEYTQTAVPSSKKEIPAPLTSIANEMEMHGIPTTILPSYLPDGFVEMDVQYNAVTQPVSLYCLLGNGDSSITLLYTVFSENQDHLLYEKDAIDPKQYEYNGTVYYIMTNKGVYFAAWTADNIECSIAGVETYDEIIKIIQSIGSAKLIEGIGLDEKTHIFYDALRSTSIDGLSETARANGYPSAGVGFGSYGRNNNRADGKSGRSAVGRITRGTRTAEYSSGSRRL